MCSSDLVVTDSGGVQEETTYLGVPCFTLRENTERPVTIRRGTNVLLGLDPRRIADVPSLLARAVTPPQAPEGWDGSAAARLADVVVGALVGESSDNLPGIPGVGPKTAAKWITQYGSLEALVELGRASCRERV